MPPRHLPLLLASFFACFSLLRSSAASSAPLRAVPEFEIDLDLAPGERFVEVVRHFNSSIHAFYGHYLNHIGGRLIKATLKDFATKRGKEEEELQSEIEGIAKLADVDTYLVQAVHLLYPLQTLMVPLVNFTLPWSGPACTGILAVNKEDGMTYHARNLDFGPAKYMQRLVYTGIFKRAGAELFRSQMIAAYSLPLTAMRKGSNGFTLETNTRYVDHAAGDKEMLRHLFHEKRPLNGWVTRKVLETATTYEAAVHALSTTPYVATQYHIIGGVRKGTILARNPDGLAYAMTLGETNYQCREDYIIITNFDFLWHDKREWFDPTGGKGIGHPRRVAAQRIMNGSSALTPEVLYNTITDFEVQAKDTIFQAIMNVETGLWNVSLPACAECGGSEFAATLIV